MISLEMSDPLGFVSSTRTSAPSFLRTCCSSPLPGVHIPRASAFGVLCSWASRELPFQSPPWLRGAVVRSRPAPCLHTVWLPRGGMQAPGAKEQAQHVWFALGLTGKPGRRAETASRLHLDGTKFNGEAYGAEENILKFINVWSVLTIGSKNNPDQTGVTCAGVWKACALGVA